MGTRACAVVRGRGHVFTVSVSMDGQPNMLGVALATAAKEAVYDAPVMAFHLKGEGFDIELGEGAGPSETRFEYRLDLDARTMTVESDCDLVGWAKPYDGPIDAFDGEKVTGYVAQMEEVAEGMGR